MIGLDFPKIEFELFGLELLEPMAIITDSIMGGLGVYFGVKVRALKKTIPFYKFWTLFFFIFGFGSILGGIGHTFYNQLGLLGKIPSWLCAPAAIYFAEKAMISLHWKKETVKQLQRWFDIKLVVVYVIVLYLIIFVDQPNNPNLPFIPIAINTAIGLIATVGVLGFKYTEKLSPKFKFFWLGVMVMLPSSLIFIFKINVHQWFDKNDFSHILLTIGVIYWYLGVSKLADGLKQSQI